MLLWEMFPDWTLSTLTFTVLWFGFGVLGTGLYFGSRLKSQIAPLYMDVRHVKMEWFAVLIGPFAILLALVESTNGQGRWGFALPSEAKWIAAKRRLSGVSS